MNNAILLVDVEPQYVLYNSLFGRLYGEFVSAAENKNQYVIRIAHNNNAHPKAQPDKICLAADYKPRSDDFSDSLDYIFHHAPAKPGSPILMKSCFSAFQETNLDTHLRSTGFDAVTILGRVGDKLLGEKIRPRFCIDATAADAQRLGYHVTFIPDLIWKESEDEDGSFLTRKFKGSVCMTAEQYLAQFTPPVITVSTSSDTTDHRPA